MKLSNIRLLVEKFDETFLFYKDVLGFTVTWGDVGEVYAAFKVGESGELSIFSRSLMSQAIGTSDLPANNFNVQDRVALIIDVGNVDQVYGNLKSQGQKFLTPPTDQKDWGIRVAHLRDPDGNLIELMSDIQNKD
ncbi:MAG TPA: VOC family protein [Bacteriovoracaceae bacterium]|nr:VOC family protein [Bacteriovoracaceae bacterium]